MTCFRLHRDPTQISEFRDGSLRTEASVATILHAAEGHVGFIMHGGTIDVTNTRIDPRSNAHGAGSVLAEHGSGQPIGRTVGNVDRLVLVPGMDDCHQRPEGLLVIKLHLLRNSIQNGRLHDCPVHLPADN